MFKIIVTLKYLTELLFLGSLLISDVDAFIIFKTD